MKIKSKILFPILIALGLLSCDNYGQFEKEMYEQMVYIVSTADHNVYALECDMDATGSIHNLSIAVSGTSKIERDVDVKLTKDEKLLLAYNVVNFDSIQKYALELPESKFNISSYSLKINAKDKHAYSLFPIEIEREDIYDLSPDSIYFIPLKIESVSDYSINEKKGNTLVRIYPRNKYASTVTATNYNLAGEQTTSAGLVNGIYKINKLVLPMTNNKVRMNVGVTDANTKKQASINSVAMVVTVDGNNKLSIEPYAPQDGLLEVEMLLPPSTDFLYNNRFEELPNPYNPKKFYQRFLLYYKYRTRTDISKSWGEWLTVAESTSRDVYIDN